jgi:hypothetical protein
VLPPVKVLANYMRIARPRALHRWLHVSHSLLSRLLKIKALQRRLVLRVDLAAQMRFKKIDALCFPPSLNLRRYGANTATG